MKEYIRYILLFPLTLAGCFLWSCTEDTIENFGSESSFIKFYGGAGEDIGNALLAQPDGSFVLFGTSSSFSQNRSNTDFYLVKTDKIGNEQWSVNLGDSLLNEVGSSIQATADGGYVLLGTQQNTLGNSSSMYLVKVDSAGVQQWAHNFARVGNIIRGNQISLTADGGFILVGDIRSATEQAPEGQDMFIVKVNAEGMEEWSRTYGFNEQKDDTGVGIVEASNGDFIWFGSNEIEQGNATLTKMRVVRSNALGNLRWDRFYGVDAGEVEANDIRLDFPGYILGGTITQNGNEDIFVVKIDENGEVIWQTTFRGQANERTGAIIALAEGGYAVVSTVSNPGIVESNMLITLIDRFGNFTSAALFGREEEGIEVVTDIVQTTDGGFAVIGGISFETNQMMCLIKLETSAFTPIN